MLWIAIELYSINTSSLPNCSGEISHLCETNSPSFFHLGPQISISAFFPANQYPSPFPTVHLAPFLSQLQSQAFSSTDTEMWDEQEAQLWRSQSAASLCLHPWHAPPHHHPPTLRGSISGTTLVSSCKVKLEVQAACPCEGRACSSASLWSQLLSLARPENPAAKGYVRTHRPERKATNWGQRKAGLYQCKRWIWLKRIKYLARQMLTPFTHYH